MSLAFTFRTIAVAEFAGMVNVFCGRENSMGEWLCVSALPMELHLTRAGAEMAVDCFMKENSTSKSCVPLFLNGILNFCMDVSFLTANGMTYVCASISFSSADLSLP